MMKVKFNKFERVAGIFVGVAILGFVFAMITVAVKQGWFDRKIQYSAIFDNADGVHPGTHVQMAGLKAGSVEDVELRADNKIIVRFYVLSKFENKIHADSQAQLIRPFIIGDRSLDISVGTETAPPLAAGSIMKSRETLDLMTVISGRQLGNYLENFNSMLGNFKTLAEAFLDKQRTQAFINMFDRVDPLLKNLNTMSVEVIKLSKQATKDENLGVVLSELAVTTKELNALLPEMNKQSPHMAKDVAALVTNLAELTTQFKVFIPALAEIAPDLPYASRRAVEALDEAVVLVKAMQKSFFVRGSAREVREEEAQDPTRKKRLPASEK